MNELLFNQYRLQFARKRRGLTAKEVSGLLGITSRTFTKYENGLQEPETKTIAELSRILDFPIAFFYKDNAPSLDQEYVSFRSLGRMSAKTRDKALCAGQIALELCNWLDKHFDLPKPCLPFLADHTPEAVADGLRSEWCLGTRPIQNIVHLLESKGIRVFSLDEDTDDMDGFSFWQDGTPFIFLNMRKSMERSRFDAAHELGHLILHKHGNPKGKEIEAEANRFASAFLIPESVMRSYSGNFITINWIYQAKIFWKVSAAALIRRLRDVNVISEWHYRTMVIELSKNGFAKKEPNPIKEREFSKLFPMVFKALKSEGMDRNSLASMLGVYTQELDALLFNLILTEIRGCGSSSPHDQSKQPAQLHIVE